MELGRTKAEIPAPMNHPDQFDPVFRGPINQQYDFKSIGNRKPSNASQLLLAKK
jgi:hypothetical protein